MTPEATRIFLRSMFDAAVGAAMPQHCVAQNLPARPKGRTIVVGTGKASAAMAQALENSWNGPLEGLIVTRYGHGVPCRHIEIVEAAHPVPDDAGAKGARRMLDMMAGLTGDDLVIALISGGGSALLSLPAEGISVEEKREVNRALLRSGAPIPAMNCVRKQPPAIQGGRPAAPADPPRAGSRRAPGAPGAGPHETCRRFRRRGGSGVSCDYRQRGRAEWRAEPSFAVAERRPKPGSH